MLSLWVSARDDEVLQHSTLESSSESIPTFYHIHTQSVLEWDVWLTSEKSSGPSTCSGKGPSDPIEYHVVSPRGQITSESVQNKKMQRCNTKQKDAKRRKTTQKDTSDTKHCERTQNDANRCKMMPNDAKRCKTQQVMVLWHAIISKKLM